MSKQKLVCLLRHAKSSWEVQGIADKDRPLKKRGIRQIGEVAGKLAKFEIKPDKVISSPAKRALVTACGIADSLSFSTKKIEVNDDLYFRGPSPIISLLSQQSDDDQIILIVGHNPDLSTLLSTLSGRNKTLSTCAFAAIKLKSPHWKDIASGGKLTIYEYPIKPEKK